MTDWPVKTLGEVCDFVRGVTYDKADARSEMKSGFIPLLRATNITEKGLLRDDFVFVPKNGVRADQKLISGDALITIASGSASVVGRSVLVEDPGDMTFGAFCGVLRPRPEILPRYLSHFMSSRSVRVAWSEAAQGTNINNLKRDDILQTECLLPPLEEQKRIVALLDDATARINELTACYEQARIHANNLFTSALREALESNPDWPVKTLGEVAVVNPSEPALSEDDPFVPMDAVTAGTRDVQYTQLRGTRSGARARAGDILFARITPCLQNGKVALIQDDIARCGGSTEFIVVRSGAEVLNGYLYQWITSDRIREEMTALMKGATGRQRLNAENLAMAQLPVPPLEEQKRIVARLDSLKAKTSEMVAAYDAKLIAAKNLRQSILEAAFAGDL